MCKMLGELSRDLTVIFVTSLIIPIAYCIWFYNYWTLRRLPCLQTHFSRSKEHLGIKLKRIYDLMKRRKLKHCGVFIQLKPIYVVGDLRILKSILRDLGHFPGRGFYYNERDPLSCHVFNTSGPKWQRMRAHLNQIFTSSKMRSLIPVFRECSKRLLERCDLETEDWDVKNLAQDFVGDVLESSVFGSKVFFQQFAQKIFKRSLARRLKGFIVENFPNLGRVLDIRLVPKEAGDFFFKVVEDAIRRKDSGFVGVLKDRFLTSEEIAAQCFIFFLAGMSTSPAVITFALYELAKSSNLQETLRSEIVSVLSQSQGITCEAIQQMRFLDDVVSETLRKYPPAAYINRKCSKNYRVPNTEVVLAEGTSVIIPVLAIHHDPEFYPKPEEFDPGRFKHKTNHSYIPFGDGPRICVGMRFGLLQTKLALIALVQNFSFRVSAKTKEPLKMVPNNLVLSARGGIWVHASRI